jgi:polygalacturonase
MSKLLGAIILLLASVAIPCTAATPIFAVHSYGAVGDGKTMDTVAIQKTIDVASDAGGGTVLFPPGTYLSGTIHVKSHVTLRLEKGVTLLGSPRRADYRRSRSVEPASLTARGNSWLPIRATSCPNAIRRTPTRISVRLSSFFATAKTSRYGTSL